MKLLSNSLLFVIIKLFLLSQNIFGQQKNHISDTLNSDSIVIINKEPSFSFSGQWFLAYQYGISNGKEQNAFNMRRGYINLKKEIVRGITGRITPDITVDNEGDGRGDLELRFKYCYLKKSVPDFTFFTNPYFELGLVHRPWLDFEEHINYYRLEGTMFLERNGIFNSADLGATFATLLGGEIDESYQKKINRKYPGRYGSLAFGVYNGGGYHQIEENNNKTFESRLTIRPLPAYLPGFQLSYQSIAGKGNTTEAPNWNLNAGFLSYEHQYFVLTAQQFFGKGNFSGTAIDTITGKAVKNQGHSFFGEIKIPNLNLSLIGRYDYYIQGPAKSFRNQNYITGIAYHFARECKVLLNYDHQQLKQYQNIQREKYYELILEVHF